MAAERVPRGELDADRFGTPVDEQRKPVVNADVKVIPAKRTASFDVPVESDRPTPRKLVGKVNTNDVHVSSTWAHASNGNASGTMKMPKTLEAADALVALADAIRAELITEGITE